MVQPMEPVGTMSIDRTIEVSNEQGLHVRPARRFVEEASRFSADITVTKDGREVDGKSIIAIMTLGAHNGSVITIKADGPDAHDAVEALTRIVTGESGTE